MVPIVLSPDDFMVTVCGDPSRDNAYAFSHNGFIGYPTAKRIKLPEDWEKLLAEIR